VAGALPAEPPAVAVEPGRRRDERGRLLELIEVGGLLLGDATGKAVRREENGRGRRFTRREGPERFSDPAAERRDEVRLAVPRTGDDDGRRARADLDRKSVV